MSNNISTQELVEQYLPYGPVDHPYKVALLYSVADMREKLDDINIGVNPEVLKYINPIEPTDEGKVVSARVDLTGEEPKLAEKPFEVEEYTERHKYRLGYIPLTSKQYEASMTFLHPSGTDDGGEKMVTEPNRVWDKRFLLGRFTHYPAEFLEDNNVERKEGGILDQLAEIGDSNSEIERLKQEYLEKWGDHEFSGLTFVTVQVDTGDGYKYPGEIPELNQAAKEVKEEEIREGNSTPNGDSPYGRGTSMISEEEEMVFGGSQGMMGESTLKRRTATPYLNPNFNWRQKALSFDVAGWVATFDYIRGEFIIQMSGQRLAMLPYPKEITLESATEFIENTYTEYKHTDGRQDYINVLVSDIAEENVGDIEIDELDTEVLDNIDIDDSYGLYFNLHIYDAKVGIETVLKESMGDFSHISDIEDYYQQRLDNGWIKDVVDDGYYEYLSHNTFGQLINGNWLSATTREKMGRSDTDEQITDDQAFKYDLNIIADRNIDVDILEKEMVNQTIRETHEDRFEEYPKQILGIQTAQYLSLSRVGLINYISSEDYSIDMENIDNVLEGEMLRSNERKAMFLFGATVGYVSAYQEERENLSQTLIDDHPVSALTPNNFERRLPQVLDKINEYRSANSGSIGVHEYTEPLSERVVDLDMGSMNRTDVQFPYSVGIAFGNNMYYN